MTDFDVEYETVYSTVVRPIKTASNQQNFLCKIVKKNGDYFTISNSPLDTLHDLYLKVDQNITVGFSFGLLNEYLPELNHCDNANVDDIVHDLFTVCSETGSIKSIKNTTGILLSDYVRENPTHFVQDASLSIFKTYNIYLVDNEVMEYLKQANETKQYWDSIRNAIYRHLSCLSNKSN